MKIQHIGIPVTNIENSIKFYTRLGFKKVMQANFIENQEKGTCVMMKVGEVVIELYELPKSMLDEIKNRKDGHIDHIAFDVLDINSTYKEIKEKGFDILQDSPQKIDSFWENGVKYFHILGPDGERLEFCEIIK